MKISEIFKSIQGEGTSTGKDVVFLRTALCNLTCEWCDTKYTWDWKNYDYEKEVNEISLSDIKQKITDYGIKHLVVTGGEPLLQQKELVDLLKQLNSFFIEIETNCTIKPQEELLSIVDQWNVSPKTLNSGNKLELCEIAECYHLFSNLDNAYFKFVTEGENDLVEIVNLISKYNISKSRVLLMPQASSKAELAQRQNEVTKLAKQHNLGFSSRLHIERWGDQRGR